jgi:hypothetical protein
MFSILGKKYNAEVRYDLGGGVCRTERYYDLEVMTIIRLIGDEMGTPKRILIEEAKIGERK